MAKKIKAIEIVQKKSASEIIAERIEAVISALNKTVRIKPTGNFPFIEDDGKKQEAFASAYRNIRGHARPKFYGQNIAVAGYVFLTSLPKEQIEALDKLY